MRRARATLWRYRELVAVWTLAVALIAVQVSGPKAWVPDLQPAPTSRPPPTWPGPPPGSRQPAPTGTTPGTTTTTPTTATTTTPTATAPPTTMLLPPPTTVTLPPTTLPVTLPTVPTLPLPTGVACLRPGPQPGPPVTWRGKPLVTTTVGSHDKPRCRPAPRPHQPG